jgi:alkylmercury lyase
MIAGENPKISHPGSASLVERGSANVGADAFAQYLRRGILDVNRPEMQHLSVTLYRLLGRGRAVTREQLALACRLPPERTGQMLGEFPPSTLDTDARGAITAFGGLSLRPTRHRFVTADVELHTWCAFDALFLSELLGEPAVLVTQCPASAAELTVELVPGDLRSARPAGMAMSIVAPDREACRSNLRNAFCDHVSLFHDEHTFTAWARGRGAIGRVTLEQAQRFARQRNALRYPDVKIGA